ncbi:hypothetical protein NNRS527_01847 [Nitrosospira sp. NRS527]|nr:hypothetical protein NNRS527_01847 [Nitrosospira sp. NRS527]
MTRFTGVFALEIPDILANSCYIAVFSATETADQVFAVSPGQLHDSHS